MTPESVRSQTLQFKQLQPIFCSIAASPFLCQYRSAGARTVPWSLQTSHQELQCNVVLSLNPYNLLTSLRSVNLTDGLYKTSEPKKTQSLLTKGGMEAMRGHHGSLRTVGSKGQCLMRRVPITIYFIITKLFSKNFYTYFESVCTWSQRLTCGSSFSFPPYGSWGVNWGLHWAIYPA